MQPKPLTILSYTSFLCMLTSVSGTAIALSNDNMPPQPKPHGTHDVWHHPVGTDKAEDGWCTHVQCDVDGKYETWLTQETCTANGFNYHEEGHCWNNDQQYMNFDQFNKDCQVHAHNGWTEPVWHLIGGWRNEIVKRDSGVGAYCFTD
ncbi:hypothetical protein AC578_1753 [Pseudocercospora eumusae]|uniref:Cyanovirin-N domain-containing protein n=1 Tax=Pseudocercospora eumusae TaxID=321146 RepID=A0A139GUX3_9PEZI|nr:hypothetical protein AC578_1753 [Pseudocercospora eumusae]